MQQGTVRFVGAGGADMDTRYSLSHFFIGKAEGSSIGAGLLCLPPHTRPLPLQLRAPLRTLSVPGTHPLWTHLHLHPQAQCQGSRFRVFLPLFLEAHSRHFPPLSQGPHMQEHQIICISGLINAWESARGHSFVVPGTLLRGKK